MGRYVTISIKVRREVKEEAERLGINIAEVLKRALEEEIAKRKLEELKKRLDELSDILNKIDVTRIVESIREDRESR